MIVPTLFLFIGLTIVKAEQQYTVEEAATRIENGTTSFHGSGIPNFKSKNPKN